jgi:NADPH:quinone reductase-like Zn-dependent oxidoreductase
MSRSVMLHEFGDANVLRIEDVTVPRPGPKEVRLKIKAIGLNRVEVMFRNGNWPVKPSLPSHMGLEAVGEIDVVGSDVDGFQQGDRVALVPTYGVGDYGLYGELSLAPARALVRIDDRTNWIDAAATWVAFATAWSGLVDVANLSAGQFVLISAASSGVGLAAIQIANRLGAKPIALTRTSAKVDALKQAGAEWVIATRDQDVVAEVRQITEGKGAEVVFDGVAGSEFAQMIEAAAAGAKLVLYGGLGGPIATVPIAPVLTKRVTIEGFRLNATTGDDAKLQRMKMFVAAGLSSGAFKPLIAKVFPFDEIVKAHEYLESGDQFGKVVVTV